MILILCLFPRTPWKVHTVHTTFFKVLCFLSSRARTCIAISTPGHGAGEREVKKIKSRGNAGDRVRCDQRGPLYFLYFCFTCPMSINRNAHFSGSSLNSTSFRKTFLNLIAVLLPAPLTPNLTLNPQPESACFLLWSRDRIYISLRVPNVGNKYSKTSSAREINSYCVWAPSWTCWRRASGVETAVRVRALEEKKERTRCGTCWDHDPSQR